jgi:anti-sigma B factor antagonist
MANRRRSSWQRRTAKSLGSRATFMSRDAVETDGPGPSRAAEEARGVDADSFRFHRHGDLLIMEPPAGLEDLDERLTKTIAALFEEQLQGLQSPAVIVDLTGVRYFGSVFISLLLRCWARVRLRGGTLVLCGAGPAALELLRLTALDTLWAIYETREEAISALSVE